MREIVTPKGSRFLLCQLSKSDPAYPKYLPIVLFLCTGNSYRKRFAEILFNSVAGKMGLSWQASSGGLALERCVNNVGPMAVEAITTLETMGVRAADAVTRLLYPGR